MSDLRVFLLGAVVLCGLVSAPAMAGTPQAAIAKYDKDHDKTLDLAEVKSAAAAFFARLDRDGDGTLDAAELRGVITPAALRAADPDNDGTLSKREYLALAEKLFKAADADHDGSLSARELSTPAGQRLLRVIGG